MLSVFLSPTVQRMRTALAQCSSSYCPAASSLQPPWPSQGHQEAWQGRVCSFSLRWQRWYSTGSGFRKALSCLTPGALPSTLAGLSLFPSIKRQDYLPNDQCLVCVCGGGGISFLFIKSTFFFLKRGSKRVVNINSE